jgi:hypothetical protein
VKQECVYFHTEKILEEAEEIFNKNKIEIIFKSKDTTIDMGDLTQEEKISLFQEELQSIHQDISEITSVEKLLHDQITTIEEIKNNYDNTVLPSEGDFHAIRQYKKYRFRLERSLRALGRHALNYPLHRYSRSNSYENNSVPCSVIIGQLNGNLVRFLEFHDNDDPVVTITGINSSKIKSQLESQF